MNRKNTDGSRCRKAGSGEGRDRSNYVYIIRCRDDSLYTGWTTDVEKRIAAHNAGRGAKYTRSRCPVRLVYLEIFSTKSEALKREAAIKCLTTAEKKRLIAEANNGKEKLFSDGEIPVCPEDGQTEK